MQVGSDRGLLYGGRSWLLGPVPLVFRMIQIPWGNDGKSGLVRCGFWVHRLLNANGIESHVVDPASIAVPRRARRAKTDAIDGETLLRTLLAWQRGEPRVCSMVVPPMPEEEDRRRISRERKVLLEERIKHVNRIKGLLASQGITSYQPLRRDRHQRLDELQTLDGRPLPTRLKSQILREIERMEMVLRQIIAVEEVRDTLVCPDSSETPAVLLMRLRGIGPEFATVLWLEGFFRHFGNRRQLAAYCGLAPSPWKSGQIDRDQGISKAGNPRLRTTAVELAWLWQRHQPDSALSRWFRERVGAERGRIRRITIVAMARKLMVALLRAATGCKAMRHGLPHDWSGLDRIQSADRDAKEDACLQKRRGLHLV